MSVLGKVNRLKFDIEMFLLIGIGLFIVPTLILLIMATTVNLLSDEILAGLHLLILAVGLVCILFALGGLLWVVFAHLFTWAAKHL